MPDQETHGAESSSEPVDLQELRRRNDELITQLEKGRKQRRAESKALLDRLDRFEDSGGSAA